MKSILVLFLSLIFISCQFEIEGDLIISNTNIMDLETGEISKRDILIRDSVIAMISEVNSTPTNANRVIDGSDYYLIPGLWDMHVHISGFDLLRWTGSGRGKRGGVRVIYYWVRGEEIILMLLVYSKKEKDDLTREQLQTLRKVVESEFK